MPDKVILFNGRYVIVKDGETPEQAIARKGLGTSQGPVSGPVPGIITSPSDTMNRPPLNAEGSATHGSPGTVALDVAQIVAGAVPGIGLPARTAISGFLGAASSKAHGNDPISGGLTQAALEPVASGLSAVFPRIFNTAALISSGAARGLGKGFNRTVEAFSNENNRRVVPLLVGETGKLRNVAEQGLKAVGVEKSLPPRATVARQQARNALHKAEVDNPGLTKITDLTGGANEDFMANAVNSSKPLDLMGKISKFDRDFLIQHVIARNNITPSQWASLSSKDKMNLIDSTFLDVRELGELKRGISDEAEAVIRARAEGSFVPTEASQSSQLSANLSKNINDQIKAADAINVPGRRPGDISRANQRFSDIAAIEKANSKSRSDIGAYAVRGALGGGVGAMTGIGAGPGTVLGATFLHPMALSGIGEFAKANAKWFPTLLRLLQLNDDLSGGPTRRRDPK